MLPILEATGRQPLRALRSTIGHLIGGVEGASALASGLHKLKKLKHLDLSHNDIDDKYLSYWNKTHLSIAVWMLSHQDIS